MPSLATLTPQNILGDQQSTFVQALSQTGTPVLFSASEKRILLALCAATFSLPIIVSAVALRLSSKPVALEATHEQQTALLPTGAPGNTSDELAMAQYFLDKASVAGTTKDHAGDAAAYLSQAQALLSATTQTGDKVDSLKVQLAGLMGTPSSAVTPDSTATSPQRVAAPGGTTKQVLGATTTSNAKNATATLKAGTDTLFVPYISLKDSSQIYLTTTANADNAIVYVKQKEAGKGFTLASTSPVRQDVVVTWYDIGTP